jgi:dolichol-phosphate mannosyltransferase
VAGHRPANRRRWDRQVRFGLFPFALSIETSVNDQASTDSEARVLIAVCTLNEADNIKPMMAGLRQSIPAADLLIVDDNSADGTAALVQEMSAHDRQIKLLVRHGEKGLGGAIKRAMSYAVQEDYQYLLNLDGDFSHDPAQLPRLLARAQQAPPVDVVVGSRYAGGGEIDGWPLRRRVMSRMVNRFATLCLRLPVSDCSGSMRCYRVDALRRIGVDSLKSEGYSVLEEVLVQLHRSGSPMAEVPITFTDRVRGESKLTLGEAVRSSLRMLTLTFR